MTPAHAHPFAASLPFSRRVLVGSSLATAAVWRLGAAPAFALQDVPADVAPWHTWILSAADELRPPAPIDPSSDEMETLLDFQDRRTEEAAATVVHWGSGPAVIPWVMAGLDLTDEFGLSGPRTGWTQALLRTALSDAVLAAQDARAAHPRESPSLADPRLTPMEGVASDGPSFPSLHATVAGAAGTTLAYLFPDAEAGRFDAMATEAAESRLWAGAAWPSDVEAGLALGRAVGELAVARGQGDGSDAVWDGSGRLEGPGYWVPTPPGFVDPPVEPMAGSWRPWVLPSGDAVRPAAPPEYGSPLWQSEFEAVQAATANRTLEQVRIIDYWSNQKGPFLAFTEYALDLIAREGLDDAHTARVLALMSVAQADAVIAVWDAKFTWWTSRPITEDPELDMLLPTPPYPSYPGGFAAFAGAAAAVLANEFPHAEVDLFTSAAEAAMQRCWSGIHYPLDDDVGLEMGYQIGRLVNSVARADGDE